MMDHKNRSSAGDFYHRSKRSQLLGLSSSFFFGEGSVHVCIDCVVVVTAVLALPEIN